MITVVRDNVEEKTLVTETVMRERNVMLEGIAIVHQWFTVVLLHHQDHNILIWM